MNLCGKIIPKSQLMRCFILAAILIFTFALTKNAAAQADTSIPGQRIRVIAGDTVNNINRPADSINITLDSLGTDSLMNDSLASVKDSLAKSNLEQRLGIKLSPDAMEAPVTSQATDSAVMDMKSSRFYLYGRAQVNYQDLQLNAGEITFVQDSSLVTAAPSYDTLGVALERPSFIQGQEKFTYDSMQYNFKSKRAIVRNARTQYGEGFVHSTQVKRNPDQSIYGMNSIYTTCALDTPHFGILARKIKVIPNKVIASGPANVMIEQVPTPLFLPFGLFPISQNQRSGFKMPMYTIEEARGVGLQQGGYYFAINDYMDFLLLGDIYSRGSYNVNGIGTYTNRYKYAGTLGLAYAYNKQGEKWEKDAAFSKDFKVNWQHRSDPKSRPGLNFTASVEFGSATYNQFNTYTANQILQNQYNSNISLQKSWQNKPYSLTLSSRHSQNTQTRQVDVTIPEVNFYIAQFNPLQSKGSSGSRWFEKISMQYNLNSVNRISFIDSNFSFDKLALNDFENGIKHNIPISASYNVLRFINMSFGANYNEYWLTKQSYRLYNAESDRIDTNIYDGFYTARDFNAGINANTRIYGVKMFQKGKLAGIRHVLSPNIGLTYTPDFAAAPYRYGYKTITDEGAPYYAPVYENGIGYIPSTQFGDFSSLVTFGLDNNLQIKTRTDKDSTGTKNIRLIDNFTLSSAYDIAADSFQWSDINVRFATMLFNIINITAGAAFNPYVFDTVQKRDVNRLLLDEGKSIARFTNATASVGGSFRSKPVGDRNTQPETKTDEYERLLSYGMYSDYADFNIPWTFSFSYTMSLAKNYLPLSNKDTLVSNHAVMFNGDFNVTPRWKFIYTSGYNITLGQLAVTQLEILRDLHCFQMRLQTIPFGPRKNFTFTLNVKAQVLQDLRLVRRRDFRDAL
jgi:hypothetical protein